jgi:hypothetical protein
MKDKRILILFLTIFIDLLGFGIVIPILPNLAKTLAAAIIIAIAINAAIFAIITALGLAKLTSWHKTKSWLIFYLRFNSSFNSSFNFS